MREVCPFCKCDPYEWVDIGVGYQAVAVSCCEAGVSLIQYGDKVLRKVLSLRSSHSPRKKARAKRLLEAWEAA